MKTVRMLVGALLALALVHACGDLDTGGGGEGANFSFAQGYAFRRDREIYVADKSDYQLDKKLTTSGNNSDPFLSADGRVVVYVHEDAGRTSLRKVSPAGGTESEIVPSSLDRQVSQPAITPDGGKVVFIGTKSGTATLYVVSIDGANEAAIPQSKADASPTFYPDGSKVLVLTGSSSLTHTELASVELTAGGRASKASNLTNVGARAVLSPDGTKVAFEAKDSTGKLKIFVIGEDGTGQAQVSNTPGNDTAPSWVSAGRIGFTSDDGGRENLYEVDVATGTAGSAKLTVPDAAQGSFGGK